MDRQIIWGTVLAVVGFFWFYMGGRQLLFNFITAVPLMKKFFAAKLMQKGAVRYTIISCLMWLFLCTAVAVAVFWFGGLNLKIGFLVGAALCCVMYITQLSPKTESNVAAFITAYSRFISEPAVAEPASRGDLEALRQVLPDYAPELTL